MMSELGRDEMMIRRMIGDEKLRRRWEPDRVSNSVSHVHADGQPTIKLRNAQPQPTLKAEQDVQKFEKLNLSMM